MAPLTRKLVAPLGCKLTTENTSRLESIMAAWKTAVGSRIGVANENQENRQDSMQILAKFTAKRPYTVRYRQISVVETH